MTIRAITLAGDPEREARLATALDERSDLEVVLRCVDRVEALAAIRGASLDAVIAIGNPHWFDHQEASEAASFEIRLVALVDHPFDAERMRELGATVLPLSATPDELVAACSTKVDPPVQRPVAPGPPGGRFVSVWGPKGSPGRTTLAIEIAAELAVGEPSTLLVDADTYGGDCIQLLGITEELPTLVWAARLAAKGGGDADRLVAELRRATDKGPVLLGGIPRADLWPEISDFGWKQLLAKLKTSFAISICDVGGCFEPEASPYPESGAGRNRVARECLRQSDRIVAVLRADPIGIKNFLWAYEDLRGTVDPDRILIVANRVRAGDEREIADILRRYLRKRAVAFIPDIPDLFARAVASGRSLHDVKGGGDVLEGVRLIAEAIGGRTSQRGFLARMAGRT